MLSLWFINNKIEMVMNTFKFTIILVVLHNWHCYVSEYNDVLYINIYINIWTLLYAIVDVLFKLALIEIWLEYEMIDIWPNFATDSSILATMQGVTLTGQGTIQPQDPLSNSSTPLSLPFLW